MAQKLYELDDTKTYVVLVNDEMQYSIWPDYKEMPLGWRRVGKVGSKPECLAYINEVWTDVRPISVKQQAAEVARDQSSLTAFRASDTPKQESVVERLCQGDHPVEVELRPERSVKLFREAIDRDYVHIKFTDTKGGTELGFQLNRDTSDLTAADFENAKGTAHLEGDLSVDYVRVKCITDIDVNTLAGKVRLVKVG